MSIMLVGADHLGSIEKKLQTLGIHSIDHVSGRNVSDRKRFKCPISTTLIVVFIDYINHTTAKNIKQMAKSQGVPLVFTNRSWSSLQDKLGDFDLRELG
jgi:hypothetical protein